VLGIRPLGADNKNNMQHDYLINTIIQMVKNTPDDMELGKKIRNIIAPLIHEQGSGNTKQILKG
jgi:hypothetical protein